MQLNVPLDEMTVDEKLALIELIWEDLCRSPEQVQSPDWHREVLAERERLVDSGEAQFIPWDEAKRAIRADRA